MRARVQRESATTKLIMEVEACPVTAASSCSTAILAARASALEAVFYCDDVGGGVEATVPRAFFTLSRASHP